MYKVCQNFSQTIMSVNWTKLEEETRVVYFGNYK